MKQADPKSTSFGNDLRALVSAVRTLDDLARLAEQERLESPFLDEEIVLLAERLAKKLPQASLLLEELLHVGDDTELVRDLFAPRVRSRFRQATRAMREALMNALRAGLLAAPVTRRASAALETAGGDLPREKAGLRAWAKAAGIEDRLDEPVFVLTNTLPSQLRWAAQGHSRVEDMALLSGVFRVYRDPAQDAAAFQETASAYLRGMAAAVREGIAEEATVLSLARPQDPALRALHGRILAARARVRAVRSPRPQRLVIDSTLGLIADPPLLEFHERSGLPSGGVGGGRSTVRIDLLAAGDAGFVSCTCSGSPACAHVLEALTRSLESIASDDGEKIRNAIAAPAWERLVDSLDAFASKVSRPDQAEQRLVWRVEVAGLYVRVRPVVQKRMKKGGFSKGRELEPYRVGDEKIEIGEADEAPLRLLQRSYGDDSAPRLALAALAGHPHVYLASKPDVRIDIRESLVSLAVREREDGALELAAKSGDVEIPAAGLHDWIRGLAGDLHIALDDARGLCTVTRVSRRAGEALWLVGRSPAYVPR